MTRKRPPKLDRERLRKLLGMLDSVHDGEALNAGRLAAGLLRDAGLTWSDIIAEDSEPAPKDEADLARLDALIAAPNVTDVLKMRLRAMRADLRNDRLTESDRRLMRVLHRKAVIDGAIIEP